MFYFCLSPPITNPAAQQLLDNKGKSPLLQCCWFLSGGRGGAGEGNGAGKGEGGRGKGEGGREPNCSTHTFPVEGLDLEDVHLVGQPVEAGIDEPAQSFHFCHQWLQLGQLTLTIYDAVHEVCRCQDESSACGKRCNTADRPAGSARWLWVIEPSRVAGQRAWNK